jgi:hypothetical protein
VARQDFIRGTRSKSPYGYARDGVPNRGPETNLLAWILLILLLSAMAIISWLFPAYIFGNPHIPFNYGLLRKIVKLDDLETFSATKPPQWEMRKRPKFFAARKLFDQDSGRPEDQLKVINDLQKRLYVQNFKNGDMLGYITGSFEVLESRVLGKDDIFPGLALRARSKDFPNLILDYLLPILGEFTNPYKPGHGLRIKEGGDLAVILHLARLSRDRLSATAISLTYADRAFQDGERLDVAVPKELNLRAKWPVFPDDAETPASAEE